MIVTVPVLLVIPAAMLRSAFVERSASAAVAGATGVSETVTVVAWLDGRLRVAVTVLVPPSSSISDADSARTTVGAPSSSAIVSVTSSASVMPWAFVAVPDTVTLLFGASTPLSSAVIVTVPVLVFAPAAIVSISFVLRLKSSETAGDTADADTVIVVSALEGRSSVAVTVLAFPAPLSSIVPGVSASVTVGAGSSSVIESVTSSGFTMPWVFVAAPRTVTLLSGESTSLSAAVIVTVPVLDIEPATIVSVSFVLRLKSSETAGDTADADTVIVVSALEGRSSAAVTVVEPPFSPMDSGSSASVTFGAGSSSAIESITSSGSVTPRELVAAADTVTLLSGASSSSSSAVIVTVPVLDVEPAAIVSVLFDETVKLASVAGDTADADTTIVVSALEAWLSVAVTVLTFALPLSSIDDRDSDSVTVGDADGAAGQTVPSTSSTRTMSPSVRSTGDGVTDLIPRNPPAPVWSTFSPSRQRA